jgi:hypothetical protein
MFANAPHAAMMFLLVLQVEDYKQQKRFGSDFPLWTAVFRSLHVNVPVRVSVR